MPDTGAHAGTGELFDAEFRARLEVLKRVVARALAGRGGSGRAPLRERGGRVEFAGHRPWSDGDDASAIDWNAYARLETLVVKEFEAPREAQLLLVLDRSASMACLDKERVALRVAAAYGWLALAAGARVACCSRGGASGWVAAPERFGELLAVLAKLPSGGEADLPAAIGRAPAPGPGRRTALLFSDFYEAEPAARALAVLAKRQTTLVCVHVLDPAELRPPRDALVHLTDAESGERIEVALTAARRRTLVDRAEAFLRERREMFQHHGARAVRLQPGDDLVAAVERLVLGEGVA